VSTRHSTLFWSLLYCGYNEETSKYWFFMALLSPISLVIYQYNEQISTLLLDADHNSSYLKLFYCLYWCWELYQAAFRFYFIYYYVLKRFIFLAFGSKWSLCIPSNLTMKSWLSNDPFLRVIIVIKAIILQNFLVVLVLKLN
jgi:hypothetical protein